jgi:fibronectin type 3 domain-containing protein
MRRVIRCLLIMSFSLIMLSPSFILAQGADGGEYRWSMNELPENEIEPFDTVTEGFIKNMGQWGDEVIFAYKGSCRISYFTVSGVLHDLKTEEGGHVLSIEFRQSSCKAPVGVIELDHRLNFFIGNDPAKWAKDVACFDQLLYEDVWPGVDILYYALGPDLKYDVILDEYAEPGGVVFTVQGARSISSFGDALEMKLSDTLSFWDRELIAFYEDGEEVTIGFREIDRFSYGFDVDKEPGRGLIIDPFLFSTSIGGSGLDSVYDLEVDESGNHFICGNTWSVDFPNTTGAYDNNPGNPPGDVFVSKFNGSGSRLIFSTFLGGWTFDCAGGMDIDGNGSIYLAGWTYGWEFPTTPGAFMENFRGPSDFYVTKFAANGSSLEYSTLVCSESIDIGYDVAVLDGQACVVGHTLGKQFPSPFGHMGGVHGLGIVFMLSRNGSQMLDFAGIDGYYGEHLTKIVLNHRREFVISGHTSSPDMPTTTHSVQLPFHNGYSNVILTKYIPFRSSFDFISNLGRLTVHGLKVDENDDIFITGMVMQDGVVEYPGTKGCIFNQVNGTRDAFIMKVAHNGSRIIHSTLIGGPLRDEGGDIEFDDAGNIYLVGQTTDLSNLTDLGGKPPGNRDGFIMKLDAGLSRILNLTYIGGSDEDAIWYCRIMENNDLLVCGMEISTDMFFQHNFNRSDMSSIFMMRASIQSCPSPPMGLEVLESDARIDLTWLPPIDDGKSMITNYTIYRGPSSDNISFIAKIGNETSFSDPDPELGKVHYYAVSAVNDFGEGALSEIEGNISTTLPSPPTDVRIELPIGAASISFGPPTSDGGTRIIKYSLYRDGKHLDDIPSGVFHYADVDLGYGIYHKYSLTSWNRNGESDRTGPVLVRTKDYPAPPRDPECRPGAGYLQLIWREPDYNGDLDIECYHIYRGIEPENLSLLRIVPFDTVSYKDTMISIGIEYFYQVLALNQLGLSAPSLMVSGQFLGLPQPPIHLEASARWQAINLTWSKDLNYDEDVIECYKIYHGSTPDQMHLLDIIHGNSSFYSHTDLTSNRLHYYQITSVSELGESYPSKVVHQRPVIAPAPPRNLRASAMPGGIILEWDQPSSTGNSPILEYVVLKGSGDGGLEALTEVLDPGGELMDMDIQRGMGYTYAVKAFNGFGMSAMSEIVEARGIFSPDPPKNTSVLMDGVSVSVSWAPPEYDGGSNITFYRIVRVDPSGQEVLLGIVGPDKLWFLDPGSRRGTTYSYYVIAFNMIGPSHPGEMISVTIEDVPGAPVEVGATVLGDCVVLTWSPPIGSDASGITGYIIYREGEGGPIEMVAGLDRDSTIFIDREVRKGAVYEYTITATNCIGEGEPTLPLTVEVETESPEDRADPQIFLYLITGASLILLILIVFSLLGYLRDRNMSAMGGEE